MSKLNMNSNFTRVVAANLLAATALLPTAAFAQTGLNLDVRANVRAQVCLQLGERLSSLDARLLEARANVEARQDEIQGRIADKRADRRDRVEERENRADTHRTEVSAKLNAQADTDAEKAAIIKFQADVQAAVTARRAAFATANDAFRKAVDAAVSTRKAAIETAVANFRASIRAALDKARQDCANGVAPETIRANFKASVEAARTKFQNDRKALDRVGTQVKAAVEVRQKAHAKAMADFRAAMEKARTELKAAFEADAEAGS